MLFLVLITLSAASEIYKPIANGYSLLITEKGNYQNLAASSQQVMIVWDYKESMVAFIMDVNDDDGTFSIPIDRTSIILSDSNQTKIQHPNAVYAGNNYRCHWMALTNKSQYFWYSSVCNNSGSCVPVKSYIEFNGNSTVTAGSQGIGMTALSRGRFALAWPHDTGIFTRVFAADNSPLTKNSLVSNPQDAEQRRHVVMSPLGVDSPSSPYVVVWVDHSKCQPFCSINFRVLSLANNTLLYDSDIVRVTESFLPGIEGLPAVVPIKGGFALFYHTGRGYILSPLFDRHGNQLDNGKPGLVNTIVNTSESRPDYFSVVRDPTSSGVPWGKGFSCFWGKKEKPGNNVITAAMSLDGRKWSGGPTNITLTFPVDSSLQTIMTDENYIIGLWGSRDALRAQTFSWTAPQQIPSGSQPIGMTAPQQISSDSQPIGILSIKSIVISFLVGIIIGITVFILIKRIRKIKKRSSFFAFF